MYRCILVDDDRWALSDIRRSFPFAQYGVEIMGEYTVLSKAYAAVESIKPEILITDICMGADNGLDLMQYHRTIQPDSIAIIISGHDDFSFAQRAVGLGAFYYMLKPVERQEAQQTLSRAVKRLTETNGLPALINECPDKDLFTQVRTYLETHYTESVTLEMLAEMFCINPSYLSALFSKRAAMSFSQYKNKLRICRAMAYLDSRYTVEETAEKTGYANSSYFIRVFKQVTGMTPKEYRSQRNV